MTTAVKETFEGIVIYSGNGGIKLDCDPETYLNQSKIGPAAKLVLPAKDQRIKVTCTRSNGRLYIESYEAAPAPVQPVPAPVAAAAAPIQAPEPVAAMQPQSGPAPVDRDAWRQRLIARECALKAAVELLIHETPAGRAIAAETVAAKAAYFEKWVMREGLGPEIPA